MFRCWSFLGGGGMLSNRKLFASALLKQNYLCDKIYVLLYQIATFHATKCGGRGGGMPLLSRSAFPETHVDKQKLSQVQSCQKDDFVLLVTSCYVKSETCFKVLANLLQGLQNQQTWCMLFQQAWHMFFAKRCCNLSDNLLREVWRTQYSIRFVWTTLLWGWYIH